MRERDVEHYLVEQAETPEGLALKFVSPGRRGLMDRIVLRPVPPEHQEIVARYIRFTEVKRPGEGLRPLQEYWARTLTSLGFKAQLVSTPGEVDQLIGEMG